MRRGDKGVRQENVSQRVRELAISGRFSRWLKIDHGLRFGERYPEARQWLDKSFVRDESHKLDRVMDGELDEIIDALTAEDQASRLAEIQ